VDVWALVLPHFAVVSSAKRDANAALIAASALPTAAERRRNLKKEMDENEKWEHEVVKSDGFTHCRRFT